MHLPVVEVVKLSLKPKPGLLLKVFRGSLAIGWAIQVKKKKKKKTGSSKLFSFRRVESIIKFVFKRTF